MLPEGIANEGHEEVWGERELITSLHRTIPIVEKCGTIAYRLNLPPSFTGVHDIFHVSQLKKCLKAPMDVVLPEVTLLEADLSYPGTQSKSWIRRIVLRGIKQSSSSRSNGTITLKKKQHGNVRTFSILAIQSLSYHRGKRVIVRCSC
jgi:hypothetical protein